MVVRHLERFKRCAVESAVPGKPLPGHQRLYLDADTLVMTDLVPHYQGDKFETCAKPHVGQGSHCRSQAKGAT